MAGYIEDRWLTKRKDPKSGQRRRTALYGTKTKRYRVGGIPGVRKRSFDTLDQAKRWKSKAEHETSAGSFFDPRAGDMLLDTYVRDHYWPTLRRTPGTKESMEDRIFGHILPYAGSLPLNRIGHDEIKAWAVWAEQRIDVSTVRVTWRHFSSIMQAAYKAKKIAENPFRDEDLKPPSAPPSKAKAWERATVDAVRAELAPRYRILVDEAVLAGLRQGECFGLSPGDIDGEDLHVVRQVIKTSKGLALAPPKRGKERVAPCPPELAEAIKRHMKEFPPVDITLPWVDPDRPNLKWEERPLVTVLLLCTTPVRGRKSGGAINRSSFDEKQWKPALHRAGVIEAAKVEVVERRGKPTLKRKRWTMPRSDGFHVLRHTFASVVLAGGESITKLADWLGHSDPAFTLRTYVHFMPRAGRRGIAALGAWARGEDIG